MLMGGRAKRAGHFTGIRIGLRSISLAFVGFAAPAFCCVVAPSPFDPARQHSDVVLVGTVANEVMVRKRASDARVALSRVVVGAYSGQTYEISHFVFDGSGMCPRGPQPRKGDRIVLYLRQGAQGLALQGFLRFEDAKRVDKRLRG